MIFKKRKQQKHKLNEDDFDNKFGFILKFGIDTFANYNSVKAYYFHSHKSCHKNTS